MKFTVRYIPRRIQRNLTWLYVHFSSSSGGMLVRYDSTASASRGDFLLRRRWRRKLHLVPPHFLRHGLRAFIIFFTIRHHLRGGSTLPTIVSFAVQSKLHLTFVTRWLRSDQVSRATFFFRLLFVCWFTRALHEMYVFESSWLCFSFVTRSTYCVQFLIWNGGARCYV